MHRCRVTVHILDKYGYIFTYSLYSPVILENVSVSFVLDICFVYCVFVLRCSW